MSDPVELERLEELQDWARERLSKMQYHRQRAAMAALMFSSSQAMVNEVRAKLLAGPQAQTRKSILNLEKLHDKAESEPHKPSGTERMLEVAKRRTALLRELLAKLEER